MLRRTKKIVAFASGILALGIAGLNFNAQADDQPDRDRGSSLVARTSNESNEADRQFIEQLNKISQQKDEYIGDRLFILNVGCGGHYEVAVAKQAQEKTQNAEVKKVAARLIQDHEAVAKQLQPIAEKLRVEVPSSLPTVKQKELQIMSEMDSKTFDKAFLAWADADHAKNVVCFQNQIQLSQSPDLKQFATETLPKLEDHWKLIRNAASEVGLNRGEAQPAGLRIGPADRK